MRVIFILTCLILISKTANSQKYFTKSGAIEFEASVPSFEEVNATNKTVTAIMNVETGELAALALVKAFRFKIALMEEHFNENYAESSKFPKTTLKGVIQNFKLNELTKNRKQFYIEGEISFHGKTKKVLIESYISLDNSQIIISSEFILNPEDFDIELAKVVRNKVADEVIVSTNFIMALKK
ncbi:MAG: hypothetical protein BM563_09805 [Bacteroidetes bacterium MedPE-SWsnd-G1]|nr:MAG: hypothetical protein BM563_09805 [Bacteroidetes bacterium MedPE-SWsnd-G1]